MKIRLNLNIFLFILIFIITRQIEIYSVLIIFAILHELAHMFIGMLLKLKPNMIELMPFGLSISFATECEDYNNKIGKATKLTVKKLIIACAGPILNGILCFIWILWDIPFLGIDRQLIIYANILIGLFNILPIYPLDGGRIIECILSFFYGKEIAQQDINFISNMSMCILTAISSIAILYFKNIAILMIVIYLWYLTIQENKRYKNKTQLYELIKSQKMSKKEDKKCL